MRRFPYNSGQYAKLAKENRISAITLVMFEPFCTSGLWTLR